nr:zinc finger CCCH domain-containing protein 65 isoform X4 [Tanacetum cinerariifolium]
DAANEKKKKRVVTQECKAKKKRKARIKRAEEKRKLGVNRPKLQVIVKEKKISICRHYMYGNCREGEKCKFSHDAIPLTKSKPCCYFARHACMKGDDCPYDHQLSKYPCIKLLSTGECDRGSKCLFSHEAQPIEPASDAFNKSMPDQVFPNSGSKRVDAKSCSTPKAVASNTERNSVDITPKMDHAHDTNSVRRQVLKSTQTPSAMQEGDDSRAKEEEVLSRLGSRPPRCEHKCKGCAPCSPIQVPTAHFGPQYTNYEPEDLNQVKSSLQDCLHLELEISYILK